MKAREPRRKVLIRARMRVGGVWGDVTIRNISSRGLLVEAASPPTRGTYIDVRRGRHIIIARVAWTGDREFGVQTQDRLNVDAVIGEPRAAAVDFKVASAQDPTVERRTVPRTSVQAQIARRADASRLFARVFDFACLAGAAALMAVVMASVASELLSRPLVEVSKKLDRN